ncbi:MAG TPA: hypothetical protein PLM49_03610 [Bacteroidales bacterium]|nr:hypothetical protein [Bacteroidales bacterium]
MPQGKPAGLRCIHLSNDLLCNLIDSPERPTVCRNFNFDPIICGNSRQEAIEIMTSLEN